MIVVGAVVVVAGVGLILRNGAGEKTPEASSKETVSSTVSTGAESLPKVPTGPDRPEFSRDESGLTDEVKALLGLDGQEHNYNSLKAAIAGLSKNLSQADVDALCDMLNWPNDAFPEGMRDIEINAVKNDVTDRLLRQQKLPEGIGQQLVDMASDSGNDAVWRDYCVQFMTPFYERCSAEAVQTGEENSDSALAAEASAAELDSVRNAMMKALDERDSTIAGTSLIGLELLSRTHEEFDREAIVAKASEIASDETASNETRMTALRMSSITGGDDTTADTARILAQTGETVVLRSAAIVTLGESGSVADRELLESYTFSDNRQIAHAARLALEKMDARNL